MSTLSHDHLKSLFSKQAKEYARYRPTYPESLFAYLSSLVTDHSLAWDCATGSGQAALKLADFFSKVIASDLNEDQLFQAAPHPLGKVEYRIASAENSRLPAGSVNLITVAQAAHWFQIEKFYKEVKRVLKPQGVLALWCYGLARINPEIDALLDAFSRDLLGSYWEKQALLVSDGYKSLPFPFEEIIPPAFEIKAEWTVEHLLGYLTSWSSSQTYLKKEGVDPLDVDQFRTRFEKAWSQNTESTQNKRLEVKWKLSFRIGRNLS